MNEREERLEKLAEIVSLEKKQGTFHVCKGTDVNSHIHTIYSFSPYSPASAVYHSVKAGLATTGIMDHDSVGGANEFIEAGRICGMPVTVGAELRVSFKGTPLEGRRINNPDQDTVAYVAFHGIPHSELDAAAKFFGPVGEARERRNRVMTERLNDIFKRSGITINYDSDVLPLSMKHDGGSVTERHLLFALAGKLLDKIGRGEILLDFFEHELGIYVTGRSRQFLLDQTDPNYGYDLLNVLKSNLVERFYVHADDECVPVSEAAEFAKKHGIILAYAYLGDVTDSVTGDKKAQKFEDDYLGSLFEIIAETGFDAVTYMPSRNTSQQLAKVRTLCEKYNLFQISGEDINQPRQDFICKVMRSPEFRNLYDSAWALIGHEAEAGSDLSKGMFSKEVTATMPDLDQRTLFFKNKAISYYNDCNNE